jgi:CubicO group peptidase (beta-lactamase class C family)
MPSTLYSTVEDLLRWDRGLDAGLLLPEEVQAAMFTAAAPIPDSGGMGYGYGWEVGEEYGQPIVSHMGGIEGFSAGIMRLLDDHTLIVVLSNDQQTNPRAFSRAILQALYADPQ